MSDEEARKSKRGKKPPNIVVDSLPALDWSKPDDAIAALHEFATKVARDALEWYWLAKKWPKRLSQGSRLLAIVATAIGGLIPLLTAGIIDASRGSWGYVALAVAGTLVTIDKFFGYSSTWMRFTVSATELETALATFRLDWAKLLAGHCGKRIPCAEAGVFIDRARALVERVRKEIEEETAEWVAEYRSSLAALEKKVAEQLKAQQPGAIELEVPDAGKAKGGVAVLLDDTVVQTVSTPTVALPHVVPGQHKVEVKGVVGGATKRAMRIVVVEPGKTIKLKLPLGG